MRAVGVVVRVWLVAAVVVAAMVGSAGVAVAAPAVDPPLTVGPVGGVAGPLFAGGIDQARSAWQDRMAWRASTAGRAVLAASRDAYAGMAPAAALKLARDRALPVLGPEQTAPTAPTNGERVLGARGAYGAAVERADGGHALMASTTPLWAPTASGGQAPVDLALVDDGSGDLEPRRSDVPVRIARDLAGGVTLDNVGLTVRMAGSALASATASGTAAFYANAQPDTDFSVVASPEGARTYAVLRSASSPEQYELDFTVDGGELRPAPADSGLVADVVRGGQVVGQIASPMAQDADGVPVAVSAQLVGDRLLLGIAHRDRGLRYPITLDPTLVDSRSWQSNPSQSYTGWQFAVSAPAFLGTNFQSFGMYVRDFDGSVPSAPYFNGAQGWYQYTTRPNTTIYEARYAWMDHSPQNTCMYGGIARGNGGDWESIDARMEIYGTLCFATTGYGPVYVCVVPSCAVAGTPGNRSIWGVYYTSSVQPTSYAAKLGETAVWINDSNLPTVTLTPPTPATGSGGWVDDSAGPVRMAAGDIGLGIFGMKLTGEADFDFQCAGWVGWECPNTGAMTHAIAAIAEGRNTITGSASDPAGNLSGPKSTTVKVDRSAPQITLSGTLKDRAGQQLLPDRYPLTISATDGVSGGTDAQARSGVQAVNVTIDGHSVFDRTQPNAGDSQPLSTTFNFDSVLYAPGAHHLVVTATDRVGHSSTQTLDLTTLGGTGRRDAYTLLDQRLNDRMSLAMNTGSGNLLLEADDLHLAGVKVDLQINRYYNGLSTRSGGLGPRWNFSIGPDVRIIRDSDDSALLFAPTGSVVRFDKTATGFDRPDGLHARLSRDGTDLTYTLKFLADGTRYVFDDDGYLTRIVDQNDNRLAIAYDGSAQHRITSITDTQDRATTFFRESPDPDLITRIHDPSGRDFRYAYTAGRLTSYTDPNGKITAYAYDTAGNLTQITDPRGNATVISYASDCATSQRGCLPASVMRVTTPANGTTPATGPTTSYDYGDPVAPCDTSSAPVDVRRTTVTDPVGGETADANDRRTAYCTDTHGRISEVRDALSHDRGTDYDPFSNVAGTQTTSGGVPKATTLGYDAEGDLTSIGRDDSDTATLRYEDAAFPNFASSSTDSAGTSYQYTYAGPAENGTGNLRTVKEAGSAQPQASLDYDSRGRVTSSFDARRDSANQPFRTTYQYGDARGNLTLISPPAPLQNTVITYDSANRPRTIRDGKGQTTTLTYDNLDRITQEQFQDGTLVTNIYDENGNLKTRADATGTTTYTYDALNRLDLDTQPTGLTTDYGYDSASNLTSLQDAGGLVTYDYDGANNVIGVTEPGGVSHELNYYEDGLLKDTRLLTTGTPAAPRVNIHRDYDRANRLRHLSATGPDGSLLKSFDYDYTTTIAGVSHRGDLRGKVTDNAGRVTVYTYDALERLATATITQGDNGPQLDRWTYTYDAAGNRTQQNHGGSVTTATYNAANELCWTVSGDSTAACASPPSGATNYTFDANGNELTGTAGRQLTYNAKDQTTRLRAPGVDATATYAGSDQVDRATLGSTSFLNNIFGIARRSTAGNNTYFTRTPTGAIVGQRGPEGRYYYLPDGLGSVIGTVDSQGNLGRSWRYDPYGQQIDETIHQTGAPDSPFRFAGEYRDIAGLYKIGQRYYDPGTGRFTQQDPINAIAAPKANRFGYAAADPVNVVDPSGLLTVSINLDIQIPGTTGSVGLGVEVGDGGLGVSAGGGGGGGGSFSLTVAPHGKVANGSGISGSGCVSPDLVGPSACFGYEQGEGTSFGLGVGTQASVQYQFEREVF